MSSKRKITIETRGPIPQKSGIVGPITVPYLEETALIIRMIIGGIKVVEHKPNGEKAALTSRDLKDLNATVKVIKENRLQTSERTALQQMALKEQERLAATNAERLEAAKAEIAAKNAADEAVEDEPAKRENLSKKERKEQARLAAEAARVNAQQEEIVEAK